MTSADIVSQVEGDTAFGMEFPLQVNPPPVGNQGVVSDGVTSGGDSATYGNDETEEEE